MGDLILNLDLVGGSNDIGVGGGFFQADGGLFWTWFSSVLLPET